MRAFSRFSALAAAAALTATPANAGIFPVNLKAPADSRFLSDTSDGQSDDDLQAAADTCLNAISAYKDNPLQNSYGAISDACGPLPLGDHDRKTLNYYIDQVHWEVCLAAQKVSVPDLAQKQKLINAACAPGQ